ncbi:MAG TPA: RNA polymerase sigma factor [Verrucomicrobiota bacterium]|nr:hypothetical protein [Verrucomicrobiales bacterium]HRI13192.1 RNA polymerase sigma factor [Verrucomicrobiota bacterium]
MEASIQNVVAAAQSGDERAANRLISEFYPRIYAFVRRLAGSDQDAEDLTQQTFTRVWKSLRNYSGASSVSSWMHGIAHHVYVDWRRADRRGEPQTDEWWQTQVAPEPGPAEVAAIAEVARGLYAAVDRLQPEVRITIHLHYYQGLTLKDTADALGVATSTVKYRLRAALDELQSSFDRVQSPSSKLQSHRS